jgi:ParB-like chromosome segregation protein Spo0J
LQIRDRIKELRRVAASQLRPNPRNWRTHSAAQRDALQGVLAEVGYAGALLARELDDGSLELIDGHLRAETTPDSIVPVLVLDVNEAEAALILATHDPLAGMAGIAADALESLLSEVQIENPAVQAIWSELSAASAAADELEANTSPVIPAGVNIKAQFQVVVECRDEAEQQTVYERLIAKGHKCRLLML